MSRIKVPLMKGKPTSTPADTRRIIPRDVATLKIPREFQKMGYGRDWGAKRLPRRQRRPIPQEMRSGEQLYYETW